MRIKIIISIIIASLCTINVSSALGQQATTDGAKLNTTDSLTLNLIIEQVIKSYPSVKQAEEALNEADAKIGLAKATYYPVAGIDASYAWLNPDPKITEFGNVQLFPQNNINTSLNLKETVYDFGKTSNNVEFENENKKLAQQTLEQVKQKLALVTVNNFFSLVYLQEAIGIKDEQLRTLNRHLQFIQKKNETGSATRYEILATKVKISTVESQKLDLEAGRKIQLTILNSLLGINNDSALYVKKELNPALPNRASDSLVSIAIGQRDEMVIALEKTKLAEIHYNVIRKQNNPMVNVFASGGFKNGYFPDVDKVMGNVMLGANLTVPIFEGLRKKNNLLQAKSNIQSSNYDREITKRNITNEVVENDANITTSLKKIDQNALQLSDAQEALSLAEIKFKEGTITNLDLLDATTAVSESRLTLLKSRIDYVVSVYKLKASLGERLY